MQKFKNLPIYNIKSLFSTLDRYVNQIITKWLNLIRTHFQEE